MAPSATATPATDSGLPVAIHQGSCDSPVAEPAWKVNDATTLTSDTTVDASNTEVCRATDKIKAKLDDLGKEPYGVRVGIAIFDEDTSGVLGLGSDHIAITVQLFAESGSAAIPLACACVRSLAWQ